MQKKKKSIQIYYKKRILENKKKIKQQCTIRKRKEKERIKAINHKYGQSNVEISEEFGDDDDNKTRNKYPNLSQYNPMNTSSKIDYNYFNKKKINSLPKDNKKRNQFSMKLKKRKKINKLTYSRSKNKANKHYKMNKRNQSKCKKGKIKRQRNRKGRKLIRISNNKR